MARTSAAEIELQDFDQLAARETELADTTVSYLAFKQETDMAPILAGLPTHSCQCPHWGVLTAGAATVRYDDGGTEEIGPGDAYYMQAGHVPVFAAGTETVMFSPSAEMKATNEAIEAFLTAQQAAGAARGR